MIVYEWLGNAVSPLHRNSVIYFLHLYNLFKIFSLKSEHFVFVFGIIYNQTIYPEKEIIVTQKTHVALHVTQNIP